MRLFRGFRAVMPGIAVAVLAAGGCKPFDPCPETKEVEASKGQLDGQWSLALVATTATGVRDLPFSPLTVAGPTLYAGQLTFRTTSAEPSAKCDEPKVTRGIAIATYSFQKSALSERVSDWQGGNFVMNHETFSLVLKAGKYSQAVEVDRLDDTMTAVRDAASFDPQYAPFGKLVLQFRKRNPFGL